MPIPAPPNWAHWRYSMKIRWGIGFKLGISALILLTYFALNDYFYQALTVTPTESRIADYAGALSVSQTARLIDTLDAAERATGAQISILIVPSLHGESVKKYGERVAAAWWPDQNEVDKHVLMLITTKERQAYLRVGDGLQDTLPASSVKRILADNIRPDIREERIAEGLSSGIEAIFSEIAKERVEEIWPSMHKAFEKPDGLTELLVYSLLIAALVMILKISLSWARKKDRVEMTQRRHGIDMI